jgi:hypothetical protein
VLTEIKMQIKRIDHIAVVVADIDAAGVLARYIRSTAGPYEDVPDQKSLVAFLPLARQVELVKPTTDDWWRVSWRSGGHPPSGFEVEDIDETWLS